MLITADKVFDGSTFLTNVTVEVDQDKIIAIHQGVLPNAEYIAGTLTAGFIDVHVNGGGGKLFNFEPSVETVETMISAHAKYEKQNTNDHHWHHVTFYNLIGLLVCD